MELIFGILLLVAVVRMLQADQSPKLCAGMYSGGMAILRLMFGFAFLPVLGLGVIRYGVAFGYFWLLDCYGDTGWYWLIFILGAPLLLL